MPKVTINDQVYEAPAGRTIIQVADDSGIEIPRYCYHPDIGIEAALSSLRVAYSAPCCEASVVSNTIIRLFFEGFMGAPF